MSNRCLLQSHQSFVKVPPKAEINLHHHTYTFVFDLTTLVPLRALYTLLTALLFVPFPNLAASLKVEPVQITTKIGALSLRHLQI